MLTDARTLVSGRHLEADVAVVGAGVAGITLARELAAAGRHVLLLESGGRHGDETDPSLLQGTSSGDPYFPVESTRVRGFGGTSNHWLDNGPFRARPLEAISLGGRDDIVDYPAWPVTRDELDPLYRRAHELFHLGGFDYAAGRWASAERPEAPFAQGRLRTSVFKLSSPGVWSDRFDEVAAHPDIHLVLHATVARIVTGRGGDHVERLEVRVPGGIEVTARADTVVLAAGGLENPRVLLASDTGGLGNGHDLVGRYFMEHPQVRAGRLHLTDPDAITTLGLYQRHGSDEDGTGWIHAKLSPTDEVLRDEHVLGSTFFLNPVSSARAADATRSFVTIGHARSWKPRNPDLGAHIANVLRHPGPIARTAWDVLRGKRHGDAQVVQLAAMAEQAPNRESRVRLTNRLDALGMPSSTSRGGRAPWTDGPSARRTSPSTRNCVTRASAASRTPSATRRSRPSSRGAGTTWAPPAWRPIPPTAWWTTTVVSTGSPTSTWRGDRRSSRPATTPTPTLTLVALALRLADHLPGGRWDGGGARRSAPRRPPE